jgi:hypothetical protein
MRVIGCKSTELNRWKSELMPHIATSLTPMKWEDVLAADNEVFVRGDAILLAHHQYLMGKSFLGVWLVVGTKAGVDTLAAEAEEFAKQAKCVGMVYCGRDGWIKANGYRKVATVAVKEF